MMSGLTLNMPTLCGQPKHHLHFLPSSPVYIENLVPMSQYILPSKTVGQGVATLCAPGRNYLETSEEATRLNSPIPFLQVSQKDRQLSPNVISTVSVSRVVGAAFRSTKASFSGKVLQRLCFLSVLLSICANIGCRFLLEVPFLNLLFSSLEECNLIILVRYFAKETLKIILKPHTCISK